MLAFKETREMINGTMLTSSCSRERKGKADNYIICTQRHVNVFMLRITLSVNSSAKH